MGCEFPLDWDSLSPTKNKTKTIVSVVEGKSVAFKRNLSSYLPFLEGF